MAKQIAKQIDPRIINHLQAVADRKNITLYRLSRKMSLSPSTLTMMARGERRASLGLLVSLCDQLNCRIEDLVEVIPAV